MIDVISQGHHNDERLQIKDIQQAQEVIYSFLLNIVKERHPETGLLEFKRLFVDCADTVNLEPLQALGKIISANDELAFKNTLKRSCYILINNWDTYRHYGYTEELVEILNKFNSSKKGFSPALRRLNTWISNFVISKEYEDIKLFTLKYEDRDKAHWNHRYTSYLLVPQYIDLSNPVEQREAASVLSHHLKDRFKFDLAMYTARCQSAQSKDKMPKNPTALGDDVLRLIKMIVAKRGSVGYTNLAAIFLKQTEQFTYNKFKLSLQKYLVFGIYNKELVESLSERIYEKLEKLEAGRDEELVDDALLVKTCNRAISYFTTENRNEPSEIFTLFMKGGNPLSLVVVLVKIILVCKRSRTHMENCIAELIQYYSNYREEECQWALKFFEIFNITFAIYADNVKYNLIKMPGAEVDARSKESLDAYRVFAQLK